MIITTDYDHVMDSYDCGRMVLYCDILTISPFKIDTETRLMFSFLYKIFIHGIVPLISKVPILLELTPTRRYSQSMQYLISIGMVLVVSGACFLFAGIIG